MAVRGRYTVPPIRHRVSAADILSPRTKIFAESIFAGTLDANLIKAGTIDASVITVNNLYANNITRGTVLLSVIPQMTSSQIADEAITEVKIAEEAVTDSRIARQNIGSQHIAAAQILTSHIMAGTITGEKIAAGAIVSSKIAAGTILASHIKAGQITADRFNSTLYGDLSQAMRYVNRVLGAGFEFEDEQGSADYNAGSFIGSVEYRTPMGTFAPKLQLKMTRRWDDSGTWWDNAASLKWDIPVLLSGVWQSKTQDIGSSETGELSVVVKKVADSSAATLTVQALYSKDNLSWGSNELCTDNVWYTMTEKNILGDASDFGSVVLTFRYFRIKITVTTTDNTKRLITYYLNYRVNYVNLFGYQTELVIPVGGVTIALSGFNKKPAVTINAMGTYPKLGMISTLTKGTVTSKLYNLAGAAVRGSVCVTIIGV